MTTTPAATDTAANTTTVIDDVYAALQTHVNQTRYRTLGTVRAEQFQQFAYATDDLDPRYFNDKHAHAVGYPQPVAPPLFLSSVFGWQPGPAEHELQPDGTVGTETAGLPIGRLRLMGAGQHLEFGEPVLDGTQLTVEITLMDVQRKTGRQGEFLLLRLRRRFHDQHGRALLSCAERFIAR